MFSGHQTMYFGAGIDWGVLCFLKRKLVWLIAFKSYVGNGDDDEYADDFNR